ncbi:hypothetical protein AAVH_30898 [Aphelenchoides avenae]|nr:hypothetical protein AAVH_30898 [Aphelenchus avenae]
MESAVNRRLPHPIQFYFTEVSNHRQWVQFYRTFGYQTHSILRNFTPDVDPCIIVEKFIQTQLDRAEGNARRNGYEPYWIGVTFRAEGGQEFYVTFKHQDENRAGRIIGEFEKFHQSARRLKLADKPVHLRITIVGDVRGAGYKGQLPKSRPAFDPDAIIPHYNVDDKTPLAAFTETGYHKLDRQSTIATKWLKWFAAAHNVNVQTRESPDGEKRIGKYKVDGFIPVAERNGPNFMFCDVRSCFYCYHDTAKIAGTVLEFQGCAYHGCNLCFKNARTENKINYLRDQHLVVEMWECQLKEMLKEEERDEMKQFFADCIDTGPLDPRQAFFGGRTGPASLRYKKKPGYAIKYLDVCLLYPHVMRKEYPISKPTLIAHIGDEGFASDVNWAMPADNPYRGLVKVRVHPPKHLVHPVLPVKHADRLVFPLCRTCMEGSVDRRAYREPGCDHTEDQRSWVGTYFTDELNLALSHGYRVDKLIGVWHWDDDQWTDQHFKGYINTFVRMKTEASGWKKEILNAADPEKAKDEFIEASA